MPSDINALRVMPRTNGINTNMTASNADILRGDSPIPSPRSASMSLQAAATLNAGLQREPSRQSSNSSLPRNAGSPTTGRRRSLVLANVHANDPNVPPSAEMVAGSPHGGRTSSPQPLTGSPMLLPHRDPYHNRTGSLGELHQELEAEQEAQVNRLLVMIRQQQQELQRLQASQGQPVNQSAIEDNFATTVPSASASNPPSAVLPASMSGPQNRSPRIRHPRSSFDIARADLQRRSRTSSRAASPRLRSTSITADHDSFHLGCRDECALYQAETQMLTRENQMLRHRIRELERQLSELHSNSSITREPATPSHLTEAQASSEDANKQAGQSSDEPQVTTTSAEPSSSS